jgi:hypothetical protein
MRCRLRSYSLILSLANDATLLHNSQQQYDTQGGGDDNDRGENTGENDGANGRTTSNSKAKKSSSNSGSGSRPKSASRRKRSTDNGDNSNGIEFKADDEYYPTARGLVRK